MADPLHLVVSATDAIEAVRRITTDFDGPPPLLASALLRGGFEIMRGTMKPADFAAAACSVALTEAISFPASDDDGAGVAAAIDATRAFLRAYVAAGGHPADIVPAMMVEAGERLRSISANEGAFRGAVHQLLRVLDEAHSGRVH